MIFAEFLALFACVGGIGLGVVALDNWRRKAISNGAAAERVQKQMNDDLREALRSRDHRCLEDWLVIYADLVSAETRKHVLARRDELYIDGNK